MSEQSKPPTPIAYTRWVRERSEGAIAIWHRPAVWPTVPGALVATMCGREIVMDSSANVGGIPKPPCEGCCSV